MFLKFKITFRLSWILELMFYLFCKIKIYITFTTLRKCCSVFGWDWIWLYSIINVSSHGAFFWNKSKMYMIYLEWANSWGNQCLNQGNGGKNVCHAFFTEKLFFFKKCFQNMAKRLKNSFVLRVHIIWNHNIHDRDLERHLWALYLIVYEVP